MFLYSKWPLLLIFLLVFSSFVEAQSGYANRRFMDNATQYDDDEGLTTTRAYPGDDVRRAQTVQIEVSTGDAKSERVKTAPKKSRSSFGMSFTDMAKVTQGEKRDFGVSFSEMAKSAKQSEQVASEDVREQVPSFNRKRRPVWLRSPGG